MKLTVLFSILLYLTSLGSTLSQSTKLSLNLQDVPVNEFIKIIEDQTEFYFIYQDNIFSDDQRVTIRARNTSLESIIQKMAEQTSVDYKIYNRQIVLVQKSAPPTPPPSVPELNVPVRSQTGTGSIRGTITDEKGFPMIGATIIVDKTTLGTIADANGDYQLLGIPAGKRAIKFSFVGYNTETREVEIERGDVIIIDIKMTMSTTEILEVVAYGQARGQQAAINQQLNASGIANVVSTERLQELPDITVADAIGRLPGVMVTGRGGGASNVVIRGMEPKYNSVTIGGHTLPSTDMDDRSTSLGFFSPEILGAVEVQKANTADKDASGLGGTVNMMFREAPADFKIRLSLLTGFKANSNSINTYNPSFIVSNRFFNNKLGLILTANTRISHGFSDSWNVGYTVQGVPDYEAGETYIKPWITSMSLNKTESKGTNTGGTFLLDWTPNQFSTIKSVNFIGYTKGGDVTTSKDYLLSSNKLKMSFYDVRNNSLLYSNAIEGKHFIFGSVVDWGGSRSQSNNNRPYNHNIGFNQQSAFNGLAVGESYDIGPPELVPNPENVNDFIDQYFWITGNFRTYEAKEVESSVYANWKTPFRFGQFVDGYVKAGIHYREKNRNRFNTRYNRPMETGTSNQLVLEKYPDLVLTTEGVVGKISLINFLDPDYDPAEFLNNKFEYLQFQRMFDKDLISTMYNDFLKDHYHFIPSGPKDDYVTNEYVLAHYLMSEINFGKYVTFIPGIRHEESYIHYKAYVADEISNDERTVIEVDFRDTVAMNNYHNFLPQIHLRIKPTDWFDIRLAYTNTLSRPDYNQLAPKRHINLTGFTVDMGNTKLNPALSTNYDMIFTFYKQKYGLLTLGAFYKEIEGFIWTRTAMVVANTATDPEIMNLPLHTAGFKITYPLNNPSMSSIAGFELDLQSNLNFLPVKGFVFNMNFTLMDSETKYNETLFIRALNPDYRIVPGAPRVIFVNQDTAYVDRLLQQARYLTNVAIGYDNKKIGLSTRLSFSYNDNILTSPQRRTDGADISGRQEYYRWDFQVNQKLFKQLTLSVSIADMFSPYDTSVRYITGYLQSFVIHYSTIQFGIKYDFF